MKYIKSYILFILMVFAVTGCTMDDLKDDVNDLKDRVTLIEQQVKLLNQNLAVVGYILDPQNKTINGVQTVKEDGKETQYIITLSDNTQLTLTIGKEGTVNEPVITVGDDNNWYINGVSTGVSAVGTPGANGQGFPEFRVEGGNWQVRFGSGNWEDVTGGDGVAGGSLGDQIFESATVTEDGKNFVVTLKDGSVHSLPILESLVCLIDKSALTLEGDFLVIEKGLRVEIPVRIEGENPQVTYPQGWRATLNKLNAPDTNGNNYQLFIYAPAADTKSLIGRAAADNTADVTVQVQKGSFWAVDKIKVKNPEDYSNNFNKYEDGRAVTVGGLEITKDVYGPAKVITGNTAVIEASGVYFVSENNATLTYALGTTGVTDLIIIPTTKEVTTINLTVNSQIYFSGAFVCQNVTFDNKVLNQYPLRAKGTTAKVAFNGCKINGLAPNVKGLIMPNVAEADCLSYFEMSDSDIKIEDMGLNLYLIQEMNCSRLIFVNNIIYFSGNVPQTQTATGHLANFRLFNGGTDNTGTGGVIVRKNMDELILDSNTFIDVESSSGSGTTGLIYCGVAKKLSINNNIYWLSYPATEFGTSSKPVTTIRTVMLRSQTASTSIASAANYGYCGNSSMVLKMCYANPLPSGLDELILKDDLFDTTDPTTFNKTTGVFIPKAGYTQYGAQR